MSWTPTVTVELDGAVLDPALVVDQVTVERGRPTVDEQPRAGRVRVGLLDRTGLRELDPLDQLVAVNVDGHRIGTGRLLAVDAALVEIARPTGTPTVLHQLDAYGPLAMLNRRDPDTVPYPEQLDGARVAAILARYLALSWFQAVRHPATEGSWSDAPPTVTWSELDPPHDTDPGTYLVAAVDEPGDPLAELATAANSGGGVLVEAADGTVGYVDAFGALARMVDDGWTDLPTGAVHVDGLASGVALSDVANRVVVSWADGHVQADDLDDQHARALVVEHRMDTALATETDAANRAARQLELRAVPRPTTLAATFRLDQLDADDRARLLDLELGTPVRLDGLPPVFGRRFHGVVEALGWDVGRRIGAAVTVTLSSWELHDRERAWRLLDDTTWTDLDPAHRWLDAGELLP